MSQSLLIRNSTAEFLMFAADNQQDGIEVRFQDENVWLSQKMMATLFDVAIPTINEHLKNIFDSHELESSWVIREFLITASDGKNYTTKHYNLDAVIAIWYRVNSKRATQFRQRATQVLKDFAIKWYVLDKKRLENGTFLWEQYYERLLEEIREIRLSERKLYQKITDIFATSLDYDAESYITKDFFATIQNKLHFAIHGHTAAELIASRANANERKMGLTSREKSPQGKVLKSDVVVAKNYLTTDELEALGRIVNAFLDLAEWRAKRNIPMTMDDRIKNINQFLQLDERKILEHKGNISHDQAIQFAENKRATYRITQDKLFQSDFDQFIKDLEE